MTYKEVRKDLAERMDKGSDPALEQMTCPRCHGSTTRGALSNYGARCFRCFEAYCNEPFVRREPSKYADSVRSQSEAPGLTWNKPE